MKKVNEFLMELEKHYNSEEITFILNKLLIGNYIDKESIKIIKQKYPFIIIDFYDEKEESKFKLDYEYDEKERTKTKVLNTNIENFGFSTRAFSRLQINGITKLGDLVEYSCEEILSFKQLGFNTFIEILDICFNNEIYLKNLFVSYLKVDTNNIEEFLSTKLESINLKTITLVYLSKFRQCTIKEILNKFDSKELLDVTIIGKKCFEVIKIIYTLKYLLKSLTNNDDVSCDTNNLNIDIETNSEQTENNDSINEHDYIELEETAEEITTDDLFEDEINEDNNNKDIDEKNDEENENYSDEENENYNDDENEVIYDNEIIIDDKSYLDVFLNTINSNVDYDLYLKYKSAIEKNSHYFLYDIDYEKLPKEGFIEYDGSIYYGDKLNPYAILIKANPDNPSFILHKKTLMMHEKAFYKDKKLQKYTNEKRNYKTIIIHENYDSNLNSLEFVNVKALFLKSTSKNLLSKSLSYVCTNYICVPHMHLKDFRYENVKIKLLAGYLRYGKMLGYDEDLYEEYDKFIKRNNKKLIKYINIPEINKIIE